VVVDRMACTLGESDAPCIANRKHTARFGELLGLGWVLVNRWHEGIRGNQGIQEHTVLLDALDALVASDASV
jgi:hypothetical protein